MADKSSNRKTASKKNDMEKVAVEYIQDLQEKKMQALWTLAGGMAQDFNEILVAIMGYVEMAQLDLPKGSPSRKNLAEAMNAINRAKDLITDLLAYSRLGDQERKTQEIVTIVRKAIDNFKATLPAAITIQDRLPSYPIKVNSNAFQIRQIITNLCTNASQAMLEKGGKIEVALESFQLTSETSPPDKLLVPGQYAKLTVRDSGCGIADSIITRILDPYFTTAGGVSSAGMGLAVVSGIVHVCKGAIHIDSKLDSGTTVTILLPQMN
ncbi:MAG: sensor histidine kinase [Thermodesulfobacteriota bacterium]